MSPTRNGKFLTWREPLGGLITIVASYIARARGANEPELSQARAQDLEVFIRECEAFNRKYGYIIGNEYDGKLVMFRQRLEELLGNYDVHICPITRGGHRSSNHS